MNAILRTSWVLLFALAACGGGEEPTTSGSADKFGSQAGVATIIGDGKGGTGYVTPDGDRCLDIFGECLKPQTRCKKDERADIVVDGEGKVVAVVCYPGSDTPPNITSDGDVTLGKTDNNGVVSLDGEIDGNVSAAGNNVTVYGRGPEEAVIRGSVSSTGNNFAVRGVTIKEDLQIDGNNGTVVLSVIEGDVLYEGNNFVMAEVVVHGNVRIKGNNAILIGNRIGGTLTIEGNNATCDGNRRLLSSGESGGPLGCGD